MSSFEDDLVLLADVSVRYFNVTPHIAARKAAKGALPVPAFRINGGNRGPLYVKRSDIDDHMRSAHQRAAETVKKMREAGVV